MRERECNGGVSPPAWRASDGRLWLATIGGAGAVDNAPRSTWRGQTSGADRSNSEPRLLSRAKAGEPGGNRTHNPQIKSLLLCQLSYRPAVCGGWHRQDRAKRPDTNRDISTSIALVQLASAHVVISSCGRVGLVGCCRSRACCARMRDLSGCAPVAQLDRAAGFEPVGRGFESLRARHTFPHNTAARDAGSSPCEATVIPVLTRS